jgi:hypothetical protein
LLRLTGNFGVFPVSYQSTQVLSNATFSGHFTLYSDGVNWIFMAHAEYAFNGVLLSSPVATELTLAADQQYGYHEPLCQPRASPTFTGTVTAGTIDRN